MSFGNEYLHILPILFITYAFTIITSCKIYKPPYSPLPFAILMNKHFT